MSEINQNADINASLPFQFLVRECNVDAVSGSNEKVYIIKKNCPTELAYQYLDFEEISEAHMFLILPSKEGKQEFEMLERKLLSLDFPDIFERMGVVFGDILLPRMELEFSANLGSFLSTIGW